MPIARSSAASSLSTTEWNARDVPTDELELQARPQHDVDGVRVGPHVVLGDGRDVADVIGDGAHHTVRGMRSGSDGIALERAGDVGQRPEGDERELAGVVVRRLQQGVDGVAGVGRAALEGEADVAHAVGAVHVLGRDQRELERRRLTDVDRHVEAPAQLACVERVLDAELERHVAGHDADADHVDARVGQRDDERDGVVGAGVGVDEERAGSRRHT